MTSKHEVSFFLPFPPVPSPRPQARVWGKFAQFYMPKAYMDWKGSVAEYVKSNVEQPPAEVFEGPVSVAAEYIITPPKTTKLWGPKPDLDNYEKSLLDALTMSGVVWKDDCQVWWMLSQKRWAKPGASEGMNVVLRYGDVA